MTQNRNRQPPGRPTGGQFAASERAGSGLALTAGGGHTQVGAETAYDPAVTPEQLTAMLDHAQPMQVRAAAARTPYPGVAYVASGDPSPYVRALATSGWDLPPQRRAELESDPQVQRLLTHLRA